MLPSEASLCAYGEDCEYPVRIRINDIIRYYEERKSLLEKAKRALGIK